MGFCGRTVTRTLRLNTITFGIAPDVERRTSVNHRRGTVASADRTPTAPGG